MDIIQLIERFLYQEKWVKSCRGTRIIPGNHPEKSVTFEEQQIDLVGLLAACITFVVDSGAMTLVSPGPSQPAGPAEPNLPVGLSQDPSEWTEEQFDLVLAGTKTVHKAIVADIQGMLQERALYKKKCLVCGKRPTVQVGIGPTTKDATWFYEKGKQGAGYYHPECYDRGKLLKFEGRQG